VVKPQIDSAAVRLINLANAHLAHAQSLSAVVTRTDQVTAAGIPVMTGTPTPSEEMRKIYGRAQTESQTIRLRRPNAVRIEEPRYDIGADGEPKPNTRFDVIKIITPEEQWSYTSRWDTVDHVRGEPMSNAWMRSETPELVRAFLDIDCLIPGLGEWTNAWLTHPLFEGIRFVGRVTMNGVAYDVVEWTYAHATELPENEDRYTSRAYIGVTDTLIHGVITTQFTRGVEARHSEMTLTNLVLDGPLTSADFAPPAGKPIKNRSMQQYADVSTYFGKAWPALTQPAQFLDGPQVSNINDLVHGKRGVLLWAWNTGCSSCNKEFPLMEVFRRSADSLGVNVVAVNSETFDAQAPLARRYLAYHRAMMPVLFGASAWFDPIWQSGGMYLIDTQGIVRYAGGFDPERILTTMRALATVVGH